MSLFVVLFVVCVQGARFDAECQVSNASKVDCGYVGITQSQCVAKGCCWQPEYDPILNLPWCYYPAGHGNCFLAVPAVTSPFSESEVQTMMGYFLANINIQGKGGVVASPDRSTPGGSYYYHWERDGALTMGTLLDISPSVTTYQTQFQAYVQWVLHVQHESCQYGDVRINPKYDLPDGGVYQGGWCRPQTDGPALRSITLISYANALIQFGQINYVKEYLWTNDESKYSGGAIKWDLDWVVSGWDSQGCDLWEEVQSSDFFWNRMAFKKALLMGAQLAKSMGDVTSASLYESKAASVNGTLMRHWNKVFVFESDNRQKDSAVIIGFNEGYWEDDQLFSPTSPQVAGTIKTLNNLFCSMFQINQKDTQDSVPGVLYGRYEGDHYAGGNPWILNSAALARLFYRGASEILRKGISVERRAVWAETLILSDVPSEMELVRNLVSAGDAVLKRIRYHVKDDGFHLAEQLDRDTGKELSATDLTWSYAEVLNAMHHRKQVMGLLRNH